MSNKSWQEEQIIKNLHYEFQQLINKGYIKPKKYYDLENYPFCLNDYLVYLKENGKSIKDSRNLESIDYIGQKIDEFQEKIQKVRAIYFKQDILNNKEEFKINNSLIKVTDNLYDLLGTEKKDLIPYVENCPTTGVFLFQVLKVINKAIKNKEIKFNLNNIKILLNIFDIVYSYGSISEKNYQLYQRLLINEENKLLELIKACKLLNNKYIYYDQLDLDELKKYFIECLKKYHINEENPNYKKVMATLMVLFGTSIVGLSGCSKQETEINNSVGIVRETSLVDNLEQTHNEIKKYSKDTLKLALLWNLEGNLEYRVIKFADEKSSEYLNTNLQVETHTFTSLSHKYETRTIIDYNYYVEDKENKYLYRSCSNAIYLDNIYTIPDYNLQGYYGLMDLNTLDLPGKFKMQTEYSLEDIKELERLLNEKVLELNLPEEQYNINDLTLVKTPTEYIIFDHYNALYVTDVFNPVKKDIYYDVSVLDKTKALKYERSVNLDSLDVAYINDYNLVGITSSIKDENKEYQNQPWEILNLTDYLNSTQKIVGKLTYTEIEELTKELNESVKLKLN